jgi:Flp pilus assembly pilin Flp
MAPNVEAFQAGFEVGLLLALTVVALLAGVSVIRRLLEV